MHTDMLMVTHKPLPPWQGLLGSLALLFLAAGCRTLVQAPAGTHAERPAAAPMVPQRHTQAEGWTPPAAEETLQTPDVEAGVRALAAAFGTRTPRVLVYFNQRLSADPAAWRAVERVALTHTHTAPGASASTQQAAYLYLEEALPDVAGAAPLAPPVGLRLEELATRALLRAGLAVVDPPMLFRRTAHAQDVSTLRGVEMAALVDGADVLLELSFVEDDQAAEGFAVAVKAVQVRDARVLALATSTSLPYYQEAAVTFVPTEGGFVRTQERMPWTLEAHCRAVLNEVMLQWARHQK